MLPGYELSLGRRNQQQVPSPGRAGINVARGPTPQTMALLSCSRVAMAGLHNPAAAGEHRHSLKPSGKDKGSSEDAIIKQLGGVESRTSYRRPLAVCQAVSAATPIVFILILPCILLQVAVSFGPTKVNVDRLSISLLVGY